MAGSGTIDYEYVVSGEVNVFMGDVVRAARGHHHFDVRVSDGDPSDVPRVED